MDALQTNIYVTDVCNQGCPSCYYTKNGIRMTHQMAGELAFWIGSLCEIERVKSYRCHILGGEPLENLPVVYTLLDKLEDSLPEHTHGVPEGKYVIFTNGELLTEDILREFKRRHVKIMLNPTMNSLEWVEDRMKMIKSICGGVSLAVVADKFNVVRLHLLAKLASDMDGHIRINRLYDGGFNVWYVDAFRKQMHKVFDVLLEAKKPMWPNFIMESTYVTWELPKNPNACGRWILIFDSDGTIRSCNADLDTRIGHIHTHHAMSDFKFTHRWSAKNLPECQGCEWIVWCQGGCPYSRKLAFGTYDKPTAFCWAYKELFPRLMELTKRWKDRNDGMGS